MIQVIMKDGTKHRFLNKIVGINKKDIAYQLEFDEKDILKIPEIKNGKLILREKTQEEKNQEKASKDEQKADSLRLEKANLKALIIAGESIGEDMTKEKVRLAAL